MTRLKKAEPEAIPTTDNNNGFKIGDMIRHKKFKFEGKIAQIEWNGGVRSALVPSGKPNGSLYIYELTDIELIQPPINPQPEPTKETK